jgi:phosphopantothenate-cysteine ligase
MASHQHLDQPIPRKPVINGSAHLNGDHLYSNPALLSGASTPASTASPGPLSAEVYFASHVAPKSLPENAEKVHAFVDRHMNEGRRVVLITVSFVFFLYVCVCVDVCMGDSVCVHVRFEGRRIV